MYWEVIGRHGLGLKKITPNPPPPPPPPSQNGVIKFNFLYFAVYLQNYCRTSYKLHWIILTFEPRDVAFCPLLTFQGISYDPKWV